MNRHMFIRHKMYLDQTDGPRNANFAKHMHVDKVSSTNVQIIKVLDIHFQVKQSEFNRKFTSGYLTKRLQIGKQLRYTNMSFRLAYLYLILIHSKGQGHTQCTFRL